MQGGRIVENRGTAVLFAVLQAAYTRALPDAIPLPDPAQVRVRVWVWVWGGGVFYRFFKARYGPLSN